MSYYSSSPQPPLQHPVPTHPPFIPEPPATPVSPQDYRRYTSSPPVISNENVPPFQHQMHGQPGYGQPPYASSTQYQSFVGSPPQGGLPPGPIPPSIPIQNYAAQWGVDGATAQLGMQLGQSAVNAGQEYVQKNISGLVLLAHLKHHFNVSNSYVLHKLRIILFPWRHRPWTRRVRRSDVSGQLEGWEPPREDINSPDLYIPTMALVTYVFLAALHSGLKSHFDPEILGVATSTSLGVILAEFALIKGGYYFLSIGGQGQMLDLLAYGGYKFVGIIVTILAGLLGLGGMFYWAVFLYTFSANAFFLIRSLRSVVLPDPSSSPTSVGTVSPMQRRWRINFLFLIAVTQSVFMLYLARV
ncbi:hypothetical protein M422DRAFT_201888 [Sphaerobolus stellatus SS14]|nr:hypothetical protein M422DRAFT_201888 [Sphaerobolus stellatus SS14]